MKRQMTVKETLAHQSARLRKAGIETSSLDASILLGFILNYNRADIIAAGRDVLSEEHISAFHSLIERRINGEPIAYITGIKEFRLLDFHVSPSVLVPRPDTETLVETAKKLLDKEKRNTHILDLCTGSGAIAIALKHETKRCEVYGADISAEAIEIAKKNALKHIEDGKIHFYLGDLFDALPPNHHLFSIIVSNPPYIPTEEIKTLSAEVQREPRLALDGGPSGLDIIERIIEKAPDYLKKGGILLLEADPRQMKNIAFLLEKRGFNKIMMYNDLSGNERVIGGVYE
jgi:release factor glutamine methyltransferase